MRGLVSKCSRRRRSPSPQEPRICFRVGQKLRSVWAGLKKPSWVSASFNVAGNQSLRAGLRAWDALLHQVGVGSYAECQHTLKVLCDMLSHCQLYLRCLEPAEDGGDARLDQLPKWGLSWDYDCYGNRKNQNVTHGTAPRAVAGHQPDDEPDHLPAGSAAKTIWFWRWPLVRLLLLASQPSRRSRDDLSQPRRQSGRSRRPASPAQRGALSQALSAAEGSKPRRQPGRAERPAALRCRLLPPQQGDGLLGFGDKGIGVSLRDVDAPLGFDGVNESLERVDSRHVVVFVQVVERLDYSI